MMQVSKKSWEPSGLMPLHSMQFETKVMKDDNNLKDFYKKHPNCEVFLELGSFHSDIRKSRNVILMDKVTSCVL